MACWQQEVSPIEKMAEWPVKARLESSLDVATIRSHLDHWVAQRPTIRSISHFMEAMNPIILPKMPDLTDESVYYQNKDGEIKPVYSQGRARMGGIHYADWMRPPFQKVPIEYYVPALSLADEKATSPSRQDEADTS